MSVFLIDKNFQKPYNRKTKNNVFEIDKILLQLDFGMVAKIICSFPAVALITCMILSIYFNSKETFSNDCSGLAKNFIPTISGAIGVAPQSYIWKIAIAMHSGVRFLIIPLSFPSYSLRIQLFIVNLILVVFIAFFMTIHRRYCAHYALSFFSLCECFLCFSIIGYHYLICYDIQKYDIMIGHPKRKII
ncbi:Post-GPI attachment to proteins factor 2 [Intoshia linei]|uniref:Post-GPI attachment to proteins factor 2 n=1 Tax=Intoshia linei TaxID=1819745 RepID=A0A177B252_9BILA|nr:Post-GPI attachment to proteins factor 2 [Intoshia linei]